MKFGQNVIFTMLLVPICHRSISLGGHDLGSLTLVQGHHKNPEIKVVFLLGKSVVGFSSPIWPYIIHRYGQWCGEIG